MRLLSFLIVAIFFSSCSHTLDFRASHFAVPITADKQWDGHIALVGSSVTKITVVNDMSANPPVRRDVKINEDVEIGDFLYFNNLGLDFSLSVLNGLDFYTDNALLGLRYQFLNHNSAPQNWVAAVQIAGGSKSDTTTDEASGSRSSATSDIKTLQGGVSFGYKLEKFVPYFSYLREAHKVSTKVSNNHGSFGDYQDKGKHQYYSIGLASHGKGFVWALEYSYINIKWDRSDRESQSAYAAKLGYAW